MAKQMDLDFRPKNIFQFPAPPNLRVVCSMSLRMSEDELVQLVREAGITALVDCRLRRSFNLRFTQEKRFWSDEILLQKLCESVGVEYLPMAIFAPTSKMRGVFRDTFKKVRITDEKFNPQAWTEYLEAFERLMMERKPLRDDLVQAKIVSARHKVVAFVCTCRHHDDCHRSFVTGMFASLFQGVSLQVLYPNGVQPQRESPRRYRFRDFPLVGLFANSKSK